MKTIKYHPILFSTPMVQAIQENRKTQTRRTKGLEEINKDPNNWDFLGFEFNPININDKTRFAYFKMKDADSWMYVDCPYNVGDILWVRETSFYCLNDFHLEGMTSRYFYKASFHESNDDWFKQEGYKWKPSIFMPKEACRIFLKIKSIRIERLYDISKEDAIQEGIEFEIIDKIKEYKNYTAKSKEFGRYNDYSYPDIPKLSFISLWESINGKESLELNPFVWVYEFEKIEKPLDFI